MIVDLKLNKKYWDAVESCEKNFEVRIEHPDRRFTCWDFVALQEWDDEKQEFTGRTMYRQITYILRGPVPEAGLPEGTVVLALAKQ